VKAASLWVLLTAAALVACGADGGASASETKPVTSVSSPELNLKSLGDGKVTLELRTPAERKPRMVDVHVRWSKGWTLQGHALGEAATAGQKSLYLKPVSDTEARVIVFSSSNTERLGDGALAELTFVGTGKGTAEIVPAPPMLAPAETEQGLHVGDPVSL
jgi:hypothetical protein